MDITTIYYVLAGVLVIIGIIGIVLPALPGVPLVFAGLLVAAWADGFERISVWVLVVLGLLTVISLIVDFWATAHGAKRVGASKHAVIGAALGTFAGLFIFPPFGLFIGPFAGAVIGELLKRRRLNQQDLTDATKIGFGTWLGLVLGIVLKLGIVFTMLGLFAFAWFI